jgi:DNA-binding HxlR family transcriptional regulator
MHTIKKAPTGNRTLRRRANPVSGCPLTAALAAIGGKWKLIIVYWLADSPRHFAALRQAAPGISQKVLTQQLRELVGDGIVHRQPKGAVPAPVEYSLTVYGRSLLPWSRMFASGAKPIWRAPERPRPIPRVERDATAG